MKTIIAILVTLTVSAFCHAGASCCAPHATPLFDGGSLDQWENPYEWGEVWIEDGQIKLLAEKKFFLLTKKEYGDFDFSAEVKMPDGKANSGFLFRCHKELNRAWGYQAEVDPSERSWSGGLYDEGRRGWIHPKKPEDCEYNKEHWTAELRAALKAGEWNFYRIRCEGNRIQIWVNGVLTTDLEDDLDSKGYIGLQHHGEKGQVYSFRNISITEL